jgi:hypothetical protein
MPPDPSHASSDSDFADFLENELEDEEDLGNATESLVTADPSEQRFVATVTSELVFYTFMKLAFSNTGVVREICCAGMKHRKVLGKSLLESVKKQACHRPENTFSLHITIDCLLLKLLYTS